MRKFILATFAISLLGAFSLLGMGSALASGDTPKPPSHKWSFSGPFGSFERPALKRGFQVYSEVCSSCHGLSLVAYRNLADIGFSKAEIAEISAEAEVEDGPDDEGEMYFRPARASDRFVSPFENDNAARSANGGSLPPDLSLIVKARNGGSDYIFALLTGYREEAPEGFEMNEDMYYNEYFPGHQIAMLPPLDDEAVEYEDGTKPTLTQHAEDVTVFLAWAASPELEARKRLGIKVLVFLLVLTGMLFALKRQIWAKLH
ncbi:MAG: cytochrome c1 [Rhodospirillales bacterium]|jgi:ubiquinol-cytochrome c reductase cytochrome c1 subunit|nr:cytochrome c1 [Rhodospirillales bacterium]